MDERGMPITEFADKICRARRTCYNIFEKNHIDVDLLRNISLVLDHDFFKVLSENYNLAKPAETDAQIIKAVGQFMTAVPEVMSEIGVDGNVLTCSEANIKEDIPLPDFMISPTLFVVTIGESLEARCKRYECDGAFKFTPISDKSGATVILCDNLATNTQSINIILDYKTKEEWRNVLELAFVTADKYYNEATKFSIKSAIGY